MKTEVVPPRKSSSDDDPGVRYGMCDKETTLNQGALPVPHDITKFCLIQTLLNFGIYQ